MDEGGCRDQVQVSLCDTGKWTVGSFEFRGLKPTAKEQVSLRDTIAAWCVVLWQKLARQSRGLARF
jgi:hypothetical protein